MHQGLSEFGAALRDDPYNGWISAWTSLAERLRDLASKDLEKGNSLGAGRKLLRASAYFAAAEIRSRSTDPRKVQAYEQARRCFREGIILRGDPLRPVEIPYGDLQLPGYLSMPELRGDRVPCVIVLNGFDSVKEIIAQTGFRGRAPSSRNCCVVPRSAGNGRSFAAARYQGESQV
jgi:hypothetical protein